MNRWVDEALPECAQWQRDLMDRELTKREDTIAALRRLNVALQKEVAEGCAQIATLEAELAGFSEDIKLPDIEAVTRCRIRVRKISRLRPPEASE